MRKWLNGGIPLVSTWGAPLMLGLLASLVTTGCTVVGFAVGAGVDASKPNTKVVRSNHHEKIRKNKFISITLINGIQLEGMCDGLVVAPDSVYSTYFGSTDSASANSPKPGDRITIVTGSEDRYEGMFLGYDLEDHLSPLLVPGSRTYGQHVPIVCRLVQVDNGEAADIFLNAVGSMKGPDSAAYNVWVIRELAANNNLPLLTVLSVTNQSGSQLVQLNNIVSIEQPNSKNSKWLLLSIGAVIDASFLVVMALTMDSIGGIGN